MLEVALHDSNGHLQRAVPPHGVVARVDSCGRTVLVLASQAPEGLLAPSRGARIVPSGEAVCVWSNLPLTDARQGSLGPCEGRRFRLPMRLQLGDAVIEVVNPQRTKRVEAIRLEPASHSWSDVVWSSAAKAHQRWDRDESDAYLSAADLLIDAASLDTVAIARRHKSRGWSLVHTRFRCPNKGVWVDQSPLEQLADQPLLFRTQNEAQVIAPWKDPRGGIAGAVIARRDTHDEQDESAVIGPVLLVAAGIEQAMQQRHQQAVTRGRRIRLGQLLSARLDAA